MLLYFRKGLIICFLILTNLCQSAPIKTIPDHLYADFTMNGTIPVRYCYIDNSYSSDKPTVYTTEQIQKYIGMAKAKKTFYYNQTDTYLYQALEKYLPYIVNKNVAVMGSVTPWYESILLHYGAKPTTIEYNKIVSLDPRLEIITVEEYNQHPCLFDAILSISSYEHDGLGRYGDPINPFGDLEAMKKNKAMLKEDGLLFLAVPIGKDLLLWNLHRVYGKLRLKALLNGWQVVSYFGFTTEDLDGSNEIIHQPIFVLKPKKS